MNVSLQYIPRLYLPYDMGKSYFLYFCILLFISVTRAYIQLNTYTYFSAFAHSLTGLISHYKSDYCKQVKIKKHIHVHIHISRQVMCDNNLPITYIHLHMHISKYGHRIK